jgi:hypothetical protein
MAMMPDAESGDMTASPQDPQRNDPTMMRSHDHDAVNT